MSFNDCDRVGGVELFERSFMCYTPGQLVTGLTQKLGFEILQQYHMDAASTWLELQKPGEFTSLRGGQTLGRILPKPTDTVDKPQKKEYTEQEIENLTRRARDLNINVDHYTTAQLEKLVNYMSENPGYHVVDTLTNN